nr:MAG TPA: Large Terminase [Bacteriophage sp.]
MFEKVNPMHPDKIADRIAGALVDLAYDKEDDPRVAVEVLLGHGICHVIAETSVHLPVKEVIGAVTRIAGNVSVDYLEVPQDAHLAENQRGAFRCGDNGIFKGMPVTDEQRELTETARELFSAFPFDGKYVLDGDRLIAHGGHPVLRWMMDNIYIRTDPAGNIKADKEKSTEKIDGAIAAIMALDRAIRNGNDKTESVLI